MRKLCVKKRKQFDRLPPTCQAAAGTQGTPGSGRSTVYVLGHSPGPFVCMCSDACASGTCVWRVWRLSILIKPIAFALSQLPEVIQSTDSFVKCQTLVLLSICCPLLGAQAIHFLNCLTPCLASTFQRLFVPILGSQTKPEAEVDAADHFGRTASYIAAKNEDPQASAECWPV